MTVTNAGNESWVLMWTLVLAFYFAGKAATLFPKPAMSGWPMLGYAILWPGMRPERFRRVASPPNVGREPLAAAHFLFGAALVWGLARFVPQPLAAGWVGMIGLVSLVHFGGFGVAALVWRRLGYPAEPIMDRPIQAITVSEFWSRRWNRAFRDLANRFVFRPCARRWGAGLAAALVFVASGLLHEVVISLPAGAGWGLPSAYFLMQALGLATERRWNLRGRVWTWVVVAGPAFWLFHPPFVFRVINPFLRAIGALP